MVPCGVVRAGNVEQNATELFRLPLGVFLNGIQDDTWLAAHAKNGGTLRDVGHCLHAWRVTCGRVACGVWRVAAAGALASVCGGASGQAHCASHLLQG